MKLIMALIVSIILLAHASAASSPFPSSVPGISIGNTQALDAQGRVLRGSEPGAKVAELARAGVTDVLIFKNEIKDEVTTELLALKAAGIRGHHIPFLWREIQPEEACVHVAQALTLLDTIHRRGGKVFFHCTVGEDRTGLLAGMWRIVEQRMSEDGAFQNEMCAHGYADGNQFKPVKVVNDINTNLTPLFHALAGKVALGEWGGHGFPISACQGFTLPAFSRSCAR